MQRKRSSYFNKFIYKIATMETLSPKEIEAKAFVEALLAQGATEETISRILQDAGWSSRGVGRILRMVYEGKTGIATPAPGVSRGESAKDAFFHLLAFSTLATWTCSMAWLVYTLIDKYFPDAATVNSYSYTSQSYSISTQLAGIIVAFPIYLWMMWLINRDIAKNPERAESSVRRWLTYLALFIAAGFVIGDVITFLASLLQGALTVDFVLKVITVLVIAGGVFGYYFSALRRRTSA
jgi:hypothetical protein